MEGYYVHPGFSTYYIKAYDEWKSLGEWEKQDVSTYREADQLTVNEGGK